MRYTPVFCNLHEEMNDATEFSVAVELECSAHAFHEEDVLVLDHASIHFE